MSGICGCWYRDRSTGTVSDVLTAMGASLATAEGGDFRKNQDGGAGAALSARFSGQQIYSNQRVILACDTDLTNEADLSQLYGPAESGAQRASTAALLAKLYERFALECFEKLRGAFAVILWDRLEKRMIAAVDGMGIKRLAYYQDHHRVLIATRIAALLQTGEVPAEVNPRAIVNVVNFSASLGPETVFQKIQRVPPGNILTVSGGEVRLRSYWDMTYGLVDDRNEERLSRRLEAVVEEAVHNQCGAQAPSELGAFLSGGTDSSTVVGMMSRKMPGEVQAFSIGFEEHSFNELQYATLAARKFHAKHRTYSVQPRDCFEALPHMVRCFDEPFGNSSAIPTYFCARLAASHGVRTMLAGDGGDELFGGNQWYATDRIFENYHRVPQAVRKGLIEPALALLPFAGGPFRRARNYVRRANLPPMERVLSFQFLQTHPPAGIFNPDFLESLGDYSVLDIPRGHYQRARAQDHLDRLLYNDLKTTIADSDLPKVTCMAELAGVEVRFPFLDRAVAEFSGCIPADLKIKGFQKRYIFKKAFRDLLPREILTKKKQGFGIPVSVWLKTYPPLRELARDILSSARARERGYFQRGFIEDLFRSHETDDTSFYGDILWTLTTLELWHLQTLDKMAKVAQ